MKTSTAILVCIIAAAGLISSGRTISAQTQFQAELSRHRNSIVEQRVSPLLVDRQDARPTNGPSDFSTSPLRVIVGADEASISDRLEAIHGLGENLSRDDIAVLSVFLKSRFGDKEKPLPALRALKNDLLNVLRAQSTPPPGLTRLMIEMYRDRAQDPALRDYAIQHLVVWYERGAPDSPDARVAMRAVLSEAAQEKNSIAGTALLGLHRLSEEDPTFNRAEIDRLAVGLVRSTDTDTAARITAIQICAERGLREALPAIELAAQVTDDIPLRLSAIAAMGRLGGPSQAITLRQITAGTSETIRVALLVALRQLEQKERLF